MSWSTILNPWHLATEPTWRIRKYLTFLNKARRGATEYPNGLQRKTLEEIDQDKELVAAELKRRK